MGPGVGVRVTSQGLGRKKVPTGPSGMVSIPSYSLRAGGAWLGRWLCAESGPSPRGCGQYSPCLGFLCRYLSRALRGRGGLAQLLPPSPAQALVASGLLAEHSSLLGASLPGGAWGRQLSLVKGT